MVAVGSNFLDVGKSGMKQIWVYGVRWALSFFRFTDNDINHRFTVWFTLHRAEKHIGAHIKEPVMGY